MSLPHVLLGLLARGPASGWDLKARLSRDASLGWDAELPQIYPALRRLLKGGFVAMKRRRSAKGPARREYRLTTDGKREFLEWLSEPLSLPRPKDATLARLAFLERQERGRRAEALRAYRALVAAALKSAGPGVTAARRRRRALLETELAWADAEHALLGAAASPEAGPAQGASTSRARAHASAEGVPGNPGGTGAPGPAQPGERLEKRATNFLRPARSK